MKRIGFYLLLSVLLFSLPVIAAAEEEIEEKPKALEAIEVLTGFGWGKLRVKGNYNIYPLLVDFDLNLKLLTQKINFNPRSLLQFQIEPFINTVSLPDANVETGVAFLFKVGILPQSAKFQPYVKAGVGLVYLSQHTREQSTQFNFIDQAGLGMHYFFRKNMAFTFEGRFRHISNCGIKQPNSGLNSYLLATGITYQF